MTRTLRVRYRVTNEQHWVWQRRELRGLMRTLPQNIVLEDLIAVYGHSGSLESTLRVIVPGNE
jgi:hypothetical protein